PPDTARWTLTGVTASGQSDDVGVRDEYYYAAFARNDCGAWSTVSNVSGGLVNYRLGDVHDGVAGHECTGDGVVGTADVSYFSANYGVTLAPGDPRACLDVGPTVTGALTSRPKTDGVLDFEDLIFYALDFGNPPPALVSIGPAHP